MNGPAPLPRLQPYDIGHERYVALLHPETAFWSLVDKDRVEEELRGSALAERFLAQSEQFAREIHALRFELKPSGVYVNPTERCNLDCGYCYLPRDARRSGEHMDPARLMESLKILKDFFVATLPEGARPQLVFHGSEPLLAKARRDARYAAILAKMRQVK